MTPWEPGRLVGFVRIDALTLWFALLLGLAAFASFALARSSSRTAIDWVLRVSGLATLLAAFCLTHYLAIAAAYLVATLLLTQPRSLFPILYSLLPAVLLAAGLSLIANQAGVWRYNLDGAGLGLNSAAFACVLAATIYGAGHWRVVVVNDRAAAQPLLVLAWHYPLLRLFSLGPWNEGWSLATLLLAGATALWAIWRATGAEQPLPWLVLHYAGLALLGIGLATGAGVALALVSLLCVPLLLVSFSQVDQRLTGSPAHPLIGSLLWFLTPAIPFGLPFATLWLAISAAFSGGSSLLAALLWAGGLLHVLALWRARTSLVASWRLWFAAGSSLLLGLAAPGWITLLVQPVIAQLQAGLTPYGDVGLWPWAGLFALDAARQPVATLPSLALAVLMLVIGALVWVGLRLWGWRRVTGDE
jgi:hypothetical protein